MPDVYCSHSSMLDPNTLIEHPDNPNRHPPEQIRLLKTIIEQNGWRHPIVISKRCGYVIKGHARLEASKHAGWKSVPVDEQDYANEMEELADMVADNKISELSHMDIGMVNPMLSYMLDNQEIIERTGFTEIEARSIIDGWMPKAAEMEGIEASDEPVISKVVVECYEGDAKMVKARVKEFVNELNIPGTLVK